MGGHDGRETESGGHERVAQSGTLLYRRLAIGTLSNCPEAATLRRIRRMPFCDTAD